jgi:HK97 family phage major capsid protein
LGTVGDIMLVDLSYYLIGDRQALTTSASPHVRFTTQETVYMFSERLDGRMWIDAPLTPRTGSNTVSPAIALATRA